MVRASAVLLGLAMGSSAFAEDYSLHAPVYFDPYGVFSIDSLTNNAKLVRLYELIETNPKESYAQFKKLYASDSKELLHYHGMLISAMKASKLPEALELIADKIEVEHRTLMKMGGGRFRPTPSLHLAVMLGKSLYSGDPSDPNRKKAKPLPRRVEYLLDSPPQELEYNRLTKQERMLGGFLALKSMDQTRSRLWADRLSTDYPNDAGPHFMRCLAYNTGVDRRWVGGKEVPVPKKDQRQESIALSEIVKAHRLAPKNATIAYYAGLMFRDSEPERAKGYYFVFLKIERLRPQPWRRSRVEKTFREKGWNLPKD